MGVSWALRCVLEGFRRLFSGVSCVFVGFSRF